MYPFSLDLPTYWRGPWFLIRFYWLIVRALVGGCFLFSFVVFLLCCLPLYTFRVLGACPPFLFGFFNVFLVAYQKEKKNTHYNPRQVSPLGLVAGHTGWRPWFYSPSLPLIFGDFWSFGAHWPSCGPIVEISVKFRDILIPIWNQNLMVHLGISKLREACSRENHFFLSKRSFYLLLSSSQELPIKCRCGSHSEKSTSS